MCKTKDLSSIKVVSQLFEDCVVDNFQRVAITHKDRSISYNELNDQANLVAKYLKSQGIKTGSIIALCMERSIELIIGMLAVVKAGGAYLNLDIAEAENRVATILANSNPIKIFIKNEKEKYLLQSIDFASVDMQSRIIDISQMLSEQNDQAKNPSCIASPSDPICIFYTSGSTGSPKGCMITHQGVTNLVTNTNYIQLTPDDNVAQILSSAFDPITVEVWGALLNGSCLKIISKEVLLSFADFSRTMYLLNISVLVVTTALLNNIVKNNPETFDNLKYLIFGGEKANVEIVRELLSRKLNNNLQLKIINVYGPTENTAISTTFNIEKLEDIAQYVPIGKPIAHSEVYVLDEKLQQVSCGTIGELYLGGKGLALGYLNAPVLTAEKFIDNPYKPGEKFYKTGDFVYLLPTGDLVFVGRTDSQIKIRGFRVELEEIERVITKHPSVIQGTVVAENNTLGEKIIVAYVNFRHDININSEDFLKSLKENLPSYMIPTKIIQVDHIPLTLNGKIDKKSLNESLGRNICQWMVKNKPVAQLERILAEIWQEALGIKEMDINQNFFDLGAHSLMLARVCTSLNIKLNLINKIIPIDIMTYPNIKALASHLIASDHSFKALISKNVDRAKHRRQLLLNRRKNIE